MYFGGGKNSICGWSIWHGVGGERKSSASATGRMVRLIMIRKTGEKQVWGEIESLILDMLNLGCLSHIQIEVKQAVGCLNRE